MKAKHLFLVLSLGLLLGSIAIARAQSYAIDWFTLDGGGGASTGGVYSVSGTIGQPDANAQPMIGGNFSLTGGFWSLFAVQTPGTPMLTIAPVGQGHVAISWTPSTPGFVLQEAVRLSAMGWSNSPSGETNPIAIPSAGVTKFFRLFKP